MPSRTNGPSKPAWWLRIGDAVTDLLRKRPSVQDLRELGKAAAALAVVFGAVLVWLAFGPFAIFSRLGFIDPWLYTGYFINFRYLLLHRGFTYYVSRLPWIIPGRIVFSALRPDLASLLLSGAIVTVSALSIYSIVRWYYGRAPATVAALALITNAYFMAAAGWHYPDGAAIAYGMAAFAFYMRPSGNPGWNGFWAGAALTLAAATNLAAAPVIVSLLAIPLWRWLRSAQELRRQVLFGLAGVLATTLLLTIASKTLLGDARVFKPQFDMWLYTLHNPAYLREMWGSGPGFVPGAVRLFTPAFLLVFGLALLVAARKLSAAAMPAYLALLICCLLYAFQQFVLDQPLLRVAYHSSYMMVVVSGFAGVALGELWNCATAKRANGTFVASMLAAVAVAVPYLCNRYYAESNFPGVIWGLLAAIGATAIVLVCLMRKLGPPLQYVTAALVLIAISIGPAMDQNLNAGMEQSLRGSNLSGRPLADSFLCLMKVQNFVKSNLNTQQDVSFWWDQDEPLANLYTSAAALFGTKYLDLTKQLAASSQRLYPGNTTLVHLAADSGRIPNRIRLLATRGLGVTNDRRVELSLGAERFTVIMQDLTGLKNFP